MAFKKKSSLSKTVLWKTVLECDIFKDSRDIETVLECIVY